MCIRDRVSSVQKRIADYCLEHPDAASFQTLREFAQTTHTTDSTVLKFCSNMGCQGFLAFRRQLQEYVRMRLSPNEKVRMSLARSTDANDTCRKIIDSEKRGLDMTFQYLSLIHILRSVILLPISGVLPAPARQSSFFPAVSFHI